MRMYTYTLSELQRLSNQTKEVIASSLVREGFLTEDQAKEFLEKYIVMVTEKGFAGRLIDKVLGLDKQKSGTQIIHVVKRT